MFIIDRFENDWVILEFERKTFRLPRQPLPPEAMEGDVLKIAVSIDAGATAKLKRMSARWQNGSLRSDSAMTSLKRIILFVLAFFLAGRLCR